MDTASIDAWSDFFTAQLGAAATLGGLVFVGLSINLEKILAAPALPNRALLALSILLATLMISSYVLIPYQPLSALGSEILCTGIAFAIFGGAVEVHTLRHLPLQNKTMFVGNMLFLAAALLPYLIGGVLMVTGDVKGLYWVAAGIVISFIKAIADAWVLLVEINR
jgi:modulator of FtsH protease